MTFVTNSPAPEYWAILHESLIVDPILPPQEMAGDFPGAALWRKSSYSNGDGGDCVEVADNLAGLVPVRDSKAVPDGPALLLTAHAWAPFVAALKDDELTGRWAGLFRARGGAPSDGRTRCRCPVGAVGPL
ncbi:DUF397 domain-containing protein [Streptomyces sp. NBC_00076]|uniref:DUF397 domain-containing protein n=1 Tax=Streptomyces sp. NBC_00076 TaxID=2975642 RepID=UPI00324CD98A